MTTPEFCEFCMIYKKKPQLLLYQDQKIFVIQDISKASAKEHILVCTIQHIDNALQIQDYKLIEVMQNIGKKVLESFKTGSKFRFGFHLKNLISIHHVHLHCFTQPFSQFMKDKVQYGFLLHSVESVINKIKQRKARL